MSRERSNYVSFVEPFLGGVWIGVRALSTEPQVALAIAREESWDIDLVLDSNQMPRLATAIESRGCHTASATTADDDQAFVVAEGDRLGLLVPAERLAEVILLGDAAGEVALLLRESSQN